MFICQTWRPSLISLINRSETFYIKQKQKKKNSRKVPPGCFKSEAYSEFCQKSKMEHFAKTTCYLKKNAASLSLTEFLLRLCQWLFEQLLRTASKCWICFSGNSTISFFLFLFCLNYLTSVKCTIAQIYSQQDLDN